MLCLPAWEVLKLLVELSYGVTYTRRSPGEPAFPTETLLSLITVGNALEFRHCVEECCRKLEGQLRDDSRIETTALTVVDTLAPLENGSGAIHELLRVRDQAT